METNGVNYYKGVLLCSRPNESPSIPKQKPFCGRVTPHDSLGLVPTKKFDQHEVRKRVLPVLSNHKKWLEGFKKKIHDQKQSEEQSKLKQIEKLQKLRQEATKRRETFKKANVGLAEKQQNEDSLQKENNQEAKNLGQRQRQKQFAKKQQKWQNTKEKKLDKQKEEEDEQVDQLLDFFENTDIQDFLEDNEVNKMLKDLRQRIQSMKSGVGKDEDWRKKQIDKYREVKQRPKDDDDIEKEKKDDILSRISKNSEAKSVVSQKTAQRVEQLEKKKQQKQWDRNTVSEKKSYSASVDMQIAKNVADEVLRNYPALKHHSNQSIRKLLEKQARQQIKA